MRGALSRRRHQDEEDESSFVSMTDMTVGFLFIVILLLAFFASKYNEADTVPQFRYDDLQARYDDLKRRHDDLVTRQTAALQEIARLIRQTDALQAQNAAKDRQVADLRAEVKRLETEIEALRKLKDDPLEVYSAQSALARRTMIERLAEAVQRDIDAAGVTGLSVAISAQGDALRFRGEGLFRSKRWDLTENGLKIIRLLGDQLRKELPCFTLGEASRIMEACNPGLSLIETVQVEGHADSVGRYDANLILSAQRAASALGEMVNGSGESATDILLFRNLLEQPVMAVAAYSFTRPVAKNDTAEGKAANRRIDLRFIMYVPPGLEFLPQTVADIPAISDKLRARANQTAAAGSAP